jgi:transposase InsO family protein
MLWLYRTGWSRNVRRHGACSPIKYASSLAVCWALWAYHYKVQTDFSRPGKLTDNSLIELFNLSLREGWRRNARSTHDGGTAMKAGLTSHSMT